MDVMKKTSVFFSFCLDIECITVRIYDRGTRDPYFRKYNVAAAEIGTGYGRDAGSWINEAPLLERGTGRIISFKGIDAVMLSCDKQGVVDLSSNVQAGHVQWLGIDLAINWNRE